MALTKSYTYNGITYKNAYIKINYVSIAKTASIIQVQYQQQKDEKPFYGENFQTILPIDDGQDNAIKQGYVYLKTLPAFVDAVDC